jgi:hypothetical protein
MNGRKCKELRKLIYKNDDFRERKYGLTNKGTIINIGQLDKIENKNISKRRIYRYFKTIVRNMKIKNMKKELFN